ncbi:hypothetical protein F2Q69_00013275 [Brassica cretica]|uniref:Uncharacterized protein n=2 Tax=Brassica TaxID=3705 RepID=A0A8S9QSE8_BRACR|nr:hypothetical protein F2Q69_00013275 [Brassica cretica]
MCISIYTRKKLELHVLMKRYKDPFEAAIEEEHNESPLDSPVCDVSDDDVGLLRQVKTLKTSEDMEVDPP